MNRKLVRRIAAISMVSTLSFTLVACPASDDDTTEEGPENENEGDENESPANEPNENESPANEPNENESPVNEGDENEGGNAEA